MSFLKGAGWGVVVGGLAVATTSVVAPPPAGNLPPARPQVDAPDVASATTAGEGVSFDAQPNVDTVPLTDGPTMTAPVTGSDSPDPVTTPADQPQAGLVEDALDMPVQQSGAPVVTAPDSPVLPNPQSVAPQVPKPETDLLIETAPPERTRVVETDVEVDDPVTVMVDPSDAADELSIATPETDVGDDAGQPAPNEGITGETAVEETTEADSGESSVQTDLPTDQADDPAGRTTPNATVSSGAATRDSTVQVTEDPPQPDVPDTAASSADTTDNAPSIVGSDDDETENFSASAAPDAAPSVQIDTPSTGVDTSDAEATSDQSDAPTTAAPSDGDSLETTETTDQPDRDPVVVTIVDQPVRTQTDTDTGVTIRRPGIAEPDPAPDATEETAEDIPALQQYAAFFDGAGDLPMVSIVVVDNGALPDAARALSDVPFPVTVVLDPSGANIAQRMATYRDRGFEVAALARFPAGGTETDIEVALEGTFDALPETIALVSTEPERLGRTDVATDRVIRSLAENGRGLLVANTGLKGAVATADVSDVPSLSIFRDLREVDQSPRTLRRFIDQAAFRAVQDGTVVLVAELTPEVLSALILWGTANRARQVSMAPLSAALMDTRGD